MQIIADYTGSCDSIQQSATIWNLNVQRNSAINTNRILNLQGYSNRKGNAYSLPFLRDTLQYHAIHCTEHKARDTNNAKLTISYSDKGQSQHFQRTARESKIQNIKLRSIFESR